MGWLFAAVCDRLIGASEAACKLVERRYSPGLTVTCWKLAPGTGANLTHYPRGLGRLVLAEPDWAMCPSTLQANDRSKARGRDQR